MSKEELAIFGGDPVIPDEHFIARDKFTVEDQKSVAEYFEKGGPNSFYGDEGLQQIYENELKSYFNLKHCVLVNSGTNALLAAYFALGLMPGDEVLVPAFSFYAVASPLIMLHATPIMVDCDMNTGLIDANDAIKKITSHTKAVVVNYVCGDSNNMSLFATEMKKRKIAIVEDISLAFGATFFGKKLGTFGDLTCCSLGSTKLLSGGQGGFVATNSREYFERIVLLGCFGKRAHQNVFNPFYRQFCNVSYGMNIRMHSLAISISYSRFLRHKELIEQRHKRYNMLGECLKKYQEYIMPPRDVEGIFRGSWHGYYALISDDNLNKDKVVEALSAEGLQVRKGAHYPLLNKEKLFWSSEDGFYRTAKNPYEKKSYIECPGAEYYNEHIISFPLFLDEDVKMVEMYCEAIDKVFAKIDLFK